MPLTLQLSGDVQQAVLHQQRALSGLLAELHPSTAATNFLRAFSDAPPTDAYHDIPRECRQYLDSLNSRDGSALSQAFLRYTLGHAILDTPRRIQQAALPTSIVEVYPRHIARIAKEFTEREDTFYSISCDRFIKDLCLLTLRLYPGGGRLIEPACGIPRRLVWQGGPLASVVALSRLIGRAHGFRPFLQLHTHISDLGDFNPPGMLKTYVRIADVLRSDERLLGAYSAGWFNDPAIRQVSPRLAYLQEHLLNAGAFSLRGIIDENSTASALSRSPTRRRLYDEGLYQPRVYYLVWPRRCVLAWADEFLADLEAREKPVRTIGSP